MSMVNYYLIDSKNHSKATGDELKHLSKSFNIPKSYIFWASSIVGSISKWSHFNMALFESL